MGWISPTGHDDYDVFPWAYETLAYDDDTASSAANSIGGHWLELSLTSAISCDKVRIFCSTVSPTNSWQIEVYYSGSWHSIKNAIIAEDEWVEVEIGSTQTVDKAKVYANQNNNKLYEFAFNEVAGGDTPISLPVGLTMSASISGTIAFNRTTAPSLTLTSTIGRVAKWTKTTASGLTAATSLTRVFGRVRTIAVGLTLSATASMTSAWTRTVAPSLSAAVLLTRHRPFTYIVPVGLTVATAITRIHGFLKTTSTALSLAVSLSRKVTYTRVSSVELSGFVNLVGRITGVITISCGLVASTSVSLVKSFVRTVAASSTIATSISASKGWTEVINVATTVATAISRAITSTRVSASNLKSRASFTATWSGITNTLVTIAASLTVTPGIAYQWAVKRTVNTNLTLTAALTRTVTKTKNVAVGLTATVSFLINEAVGRLLQVFTAESHIFGMKSVISHAKKMLTRESH